VGVGFGCLRGGLAGALVSGLEGTYFWLVVQGLAGCVVVVGGGEGRLRFVG